MKLKVSTEQMISGELVSNYFRNLVNSFFKILPLRENEEATIGIYMRSLQKEIIGCKELVNTFNNDAMFMSLLSILEYLIDNPNCEVSEVKREVFNAIAICNKLEQKYALSEEGNT